MLSRWSPTPKQREAIAAGADIFLELMTFGTPLQPILMFVGEPSAYCIKKEYGLIKSDPVIGIALSHETSTVPSAKV